MPHVYRVSSAFLRRASVPVLLAVSSIFLDTFPCPKLHAGRLIPKGGTTFKLSQVLFLLSIISVVNSPTCTLDGHLGQPQPAPNQPSTRPQQGESNFGDSSGPLFSMYSKIAKEEDDEMAESWQKDADGILIFVRPFVNICTATHIN